MYDLQKTRERAGSTDTTGEWLGDGAATSSDGLLHYVMQLDVYGGGIWGSGSSDSD